jgi:hypothetical protein
MNEGWDLIRENLKVRDRVKIGDRWYEIKDTLRLRGIGEVDGFQHHMLFRDVENKNTLVTTYIHLIMDIDIEGERGELLKSLLILTRLSK